MTIVWHSTERNSDKFGIFLYDTYFNVSNWSTNLDQSILVGDPVDNCDHISVLKASLNMD